MRIVKSLVREGKELMNMLVCLFQESIEYGSFPPILAKQLEVEHPIIFPFSIYFVKVNDDGR